MSDVMHGITFFFFSTEITMRVKIVLFPCLLLLVVLMGEVKPGLAKKGQKLKQRVKKLEESIAELTKKIKEQEEELGEQKEKLEEQEAKLTEQEERINELEECKGKYT